MGWASRIRRRRAFEAWWNYMDEAKRCLWRAQGREQERKRRKKEAKEARSKARVIAILMGLRPGDAGWPKEPMVAASLSHFRPGFHVPFDLDGQEAKEPQGEGGQGGRQRVRRLGRGRGVAMGRRLPRWAPSSSSPATASTYCCGWRLAVLCAPRLTYTYAEATFSC